MERKAFLDQQPPPGYVAGIGRGATGFVTGGDSGALETLNQFENSDSENENDVSDVGLLAGKTKDDDEAEKIYEEIEKRLSSRRRDNQVTKVEEEDQLENRFTDLKRALTTVSEDQWKQLPEAIDLTKRNKRMRLLEQSRQRFYATPDNLIAAQSGINTNENKKSLIDDLINNDDIELDNQMADIEHNRSLLRSLRNSKPGSASSWIASARLEVKAKNFVMARKFINEGCKRVPTDESIWLESIKIHQNSTDGNKLAKAIVDTALKHKSTSEKLWIKALEFENPGDVNSKRRILMKGIEQLPTNVKLWQLMIELQDDEEDVKKMLTKVIELCPTEWSFWLSLINLSDYSEAKTIINRARKEMKDNHQIWITALKLEERENNTISEDKLIKMLSKALKQLDANTDESRKVTIRQWLDEAAKAEKEGFLLTCKAIIVNCLTESSDFFVEADYYITKKCFQTANYIYEYALSKKPKDIVSWMKFFNIFKSLENFNVQDIYKFYIQAIEFNPEQEVFHLMMAKDKWKIEGDIPGARKILDTALEKFPGKEDVWHAKIKFEVKNKCFENARNTSDKMMESITTPRAYFKHIHLLRFLKLDAIQFCDKGLSEYPEEEKFYLQKGQILHQQGKLEESREVYSIGTNKLPQSINLWLSLSRIDEELKIIIRARSVLDRALLKNPDNDKLWVEKIELERRNGDIIAARQFCSKALRTLNKSPLIWVEHLTLIPKMSQRKNAFLDALNATDNSPIILMNIGLFFWVDGKISKAKSWFERALTNDNTNGDIWGWLYNFYSQHGTKEELQKFLNEFQQHEDSINRGNTWNKVAKRVENLDKSQHDILVETAAHLKRHSTM
ncbi:pre-mRNA-splicing factor 6 [[Candida] jaroonii]|uniref:Pre-mRNA-splicing factor 6 n=1 Tax=[Candida] jaroonii TaxID=467808 RepID=A0ACA9Y6X7_9ASCO|nr:pre-mRNA-splicing factor 6 [[Candida] jaroonii]